MRVFLAVFFIIFSSITVFANPLTEVQPQTAIMGEATTAVLQMQEWARTRDASETFIELAPIYYDISVKKGVDPNVTYTQSAKETNFGRFGNVLDDTFFNPCGLKITAGGDNDDPDAHQRFSSWEEGIQAQVDHLALYAGIATENSPDPRHFISIKGTAPTVESLGGKWAPSITYGDEMVRYMEELASTDVQAVHILDSNSVFIDNEVHINGEALSLPKNVLLPLRDISAELGIQTFWDGERREIQIPYYKTVLSIDKKTYTVDGVTKRLPYAPVIVDNRAMVPLTAFSDIFDKKVEAVIILGTATTNFSYPNTLNYKQINITEIMEVLP